MILMTSGKSNTTVEASHKIECRSSAHLKEYLDRNDPCSDLWKSLPCNTISQATMSKGNTILGDGLRFGIVRD